MNKFTDDFGFDGYDEGDVKNLLSHTRDLEAMLRKMEWDRSERIVTCSWCGQPKKENRENMGHAMDCPLPKLLD